MSMPKGHKSQHGYATVSGIDGGLDYRSIALKMTDEELARLARAASKEIVQLDVHGVYPFAVMAKPEPNS